MDELRARIDATVAFLDGLDPAAFDGVEKNETPVPFAKGMVAEVGDFFREFSVPNFYFHASHAYAILRHDGVPLGKRTYIGHVTLKPAG
jgi:hypothetical protein